MPQRIKLTREVSRKNGMPIRLSVSTTVFITNFIYRQMPFYQAVKLFIYASKLQSVALGNQKQQYQFFSYYFKIRAYPFTHFI